MNQITTHATASAIGTEPQAEVRPRAEQVREHGACPVFRDCTVTERGHLDHFSRTVFADDSDGSTILDAGMVGLSGSDHHAVVCLRNAEFTDAASVLAKTAELRAFLDQVDEMAVRVFNDHKARG